MASQISCIWENCYFLIWFLLHFYTFKWIHQNVVKPPAIQNTLFLDEIRRISKRTETKMILTTAQYLQSSIKYFVWNRRSKKSTLKYQLTRHLFFHVKQQCCTRIHFLFLCYNTNRFSIGFIEYCVVCLVCVCA